MKSYYFTSVLALLITVVLIAGCGQSRDKSVSAARADAPSLKPAAVYPAYMAKLKERDVKGACALYSSGGVDNLINDSHAVWENNKKPKDCEEAQSQIINKMDAFFGDDWAKLSIIVNNVKVSDDQAVVNYTASIDQTRTLNAAALERIDGHWLIAKD